MKCHDFDAVMLPSVVAPDIPAMVGTPVITVPLGAPSAETEIEMKKGWNVVKSSPGFLFGVSCLGAKSSAEALTGMAYTFEQRSLVRGGIEGLGDA